MLKKRGRIPRHLQSSKKQRQAHLLKEAARTTDEVTLTQLFRQPKSRPTPVALSRASKSSTSRSSTSSASSSVAPGQKNPTVASSPLTIEIDASQPVVCPLVPRCDGIQGVSWEEINGDWSSQRENFLDWIQRAPTVEDWNRLNVWVGVMLEQQRLDLVRQMLRTLIYNDLSQAWTLHSFFPSFLVDVQRIVFMKHNNLLKIL